MLKQANLSFSVTAQANGNDTNTIQFSTQDKKTAKLIFTIKEGKEPLNLTDIDGEITLVMQDKSRFVDKTKVTKPLDGIIEYTLTQEQIRHAGRAQGEVVLKARDGSSVGGFRFNFTIKKALMDEDLGPVKDFYINDLEAVKQEVQEKADTINTDIDNFKQNVDQRTTAIEETITQLEEGVTESVVVQVETAKKDTTGQTHDNLDSRIKADVGRVSGRLAENEKKLLDDGVSVWKWYSDVKNKGFAEEDWTVAIQKGHDYCYANKKALLFPPYTKYSIYNTVYLNPIATFMGAQRQGTNTTNFETLINLYANIVFAPKEAVVNKVPINLHLYMTDLGFYTRLDLDNSQIIFNKFSFNSSFMDRNYFYNIGTFLKGNLRGINRFNRNIFMVTNKYVIDALEDGDTTYNASGNAELYDSYFTNNYVAGNPVSASGKVFRAKSAHLCDFAENWFEFLENVYQTTDTDFGVNIVENVFDYCITPIIPGAATGVNISGNKFHANAVKYAEHSVWRNEARPKLRTAKYYCIDMKKATSAIIEQNQFISCDIGILLDVDKQYKDVKIKNNIKYKARDWNNTPDPDAENLISYVSSSSEIWKFPKNIFINQSDNKDVSELPFPTVPDDNGATQTYHNHQVFHNDRLLINRNGIFYTTDGQPVYESVFGDKVVRYLPNSKVRDIVNEDGTITSNIIAAILNGGEDWIVDSNAPQNKTMLFQIRNAISKVDTGSTWREKTVNIISDKIKPTSAYRLYSSDIEGVSIGKYGALQLRISKSKLATPNVAGLKSWLGSNNLKVSYEKQ